MCSRQTSSIFRKNPYLLHNPNRILRDSMRSLCVLDPIVPKFTVASSLNAVFTSANVIAAAAAAGSGSVHGAVTSALTHVAVTAVAIASGACLSTKVDFLWPKVEEQPGALILDGVDVTGYPIFYDSKAGAKGNCIRKASSPWPVTENGRPIFNSLYPYRENHSCLSSNKWETSCQYSCGCNSP